MFKIIGIIVVCWYAIGFLFGIAAMLTDEDIRRLKIGLDDIVCLALCVFGGPIIPCIMIFCYIVEYIEEHW